MMQESAEDSPARTNELEPVPLDSPSNTVQEYKSEKPKVKRVYITGRTLHIKLLGEYSITLYEVVMFLLLIPVWWGFGYFTLGKLALPGHSVFDLCVCVLVAMVIGNFVCTLFCLPTLLGIMLVAIAMKNLGLVDGIDNRHSSILRNVALTIILVRAGFGMNLTELRKRSLQCVLLSTLPQAAEASIYALLMKAFLGWEWAWGFLLGFLLAAVSPAVIVPSILKLQQAGYGTDKGIPTLILAAAALDDVVALTVFGVCLGFAVGADGKGPVWLGIQAPLQIVGGVLAGILGGLFCSQLIQWRGKMVVMGTDKEKSLNRLLVALQVGLALLFVFGAKKVELSGGGVLAAMSMGVTVAYRVGSSNTVLIQTQGFLGDIWRHLGMAVLFTLIGASVDLGNIKSKDVLGKGIATMFIALIGRTIAALFATLGSPLTMKERLFVALAWIPKATVQAALGGVALDTARDLQEQNPTADYSTELELGLAVLTIAVLGILFTASIGAVFIALAGPRWLVHTAPAGAQPASDTAETPPVDHTSLELQDCPHGAAPKQK